MKRNWKWFAGISALMLALVATIIFSSGLTSSAQAYGGPNGNRGAGMGGQTTGTPCATCTGTGVNQGTGNQNRMGAEQGVMSGMGQGRGAMPGEGMGMMGRGSNGRGAMGNGGGGMGLFAQYSNTPLNEAAKQALTEAINEEYLAHATYQAIIDKFGQELPFVNIVNSENIHVNALARLFSNHGLAVPADPSAGKVTAPATLAEAFTAAIQLEKDDAALYDKLLKTVTETDIVRVFTNLQSASLNMHLKSLEFYSK